MSTKSCLTVLSSAHALFWRRVQIRSKEDQDGILASLSASELELRLDLRPFMQRHPCAVNNAQGLDQRRSQGRIWSN
jgi:hypothetical protein